MIEPRRLQRHLRATLAHQAKPARVGPYNCFFHPDLDYGELNVAIPDEPADGRRVPVLSHQASGLAAVPDDDPEYALMMLEAQFRARKRTPRVEFIAECHPELPEVLERAGFAEIARVPILANTTETWKSAPDVAGLRVDPVLPSSPWDTIKSYLEVQRDAFAMPLDVPATAPRDPWSALGIGAGVVALLDGTPAGAGGFTAPEDGICEIRGLAVRPEQQRRGIATFLLSALARVAHEGGVEVVLATPDGPATARLAKRAGYVPAATLVTFVSDGASRSEPSR